MPNITLSLPDDVYKKMKKHFQVKWSEVARRAIINEIEKFEAIEKIASKSKLTLKDVEELDKKIKEGMRNHFKV